MKDERGWRLSGSLVGAGAEAGAGGLALSWGLSFCFGCLLPVCMFCIHGLLIPTGGKDFTLVRPTELFYYLVLILSAKHTSSVLPSPECLSPNDCVLNTDCV